MQGKDTINVLYIDDEEAEFLIVKMLLKSVEWANLKLHWKSSFEEGVDALLNHVEDYDICLTDYMLGAETGLDLISHVIESGCEIPIILLTGQGDHDIDRAAMAAGAADYLSKDEINGRMIERTIRYAIDHKKTELELKAINLKMQQIAEYDQLTGLPNRNLFSKTLPIVLARAERNNCAVALLFLDLDKFKNVNDSMGHDTGDLLLQEVAHRLKQTLRKTDIISRLGGDEFTVILEGKLDAPKIAIVADKIIKTLRKPFCIQNRDLYITVSIGVATTIGCGINPELLLKCADTAMYSAKDKGRNNFQFYTEALNQEVQERVRIESNLRQAIRCNEFFLVYQPIISFKTNTISALEALIRWKTQSGEIVSPFDFIPIAEETGLISPIGEWVLLTACEQLQKWSIDCSLPLLSMSVNVSMRQLNDPKFLGVVEDVLRSTKINPKQLSLELTESTIMTDPSGSIAILNELHSLGLSISVDDFGTGYSSLAYLSCLPLDSLKVDRAFVRDLSYDPNDAIIVKTIISLAKNLGFTVVAEGVETKEQLAFVRENRCDYFQGYYFSPPVSPEEIMTMLIEKRGI